MNGVIQTNPSSREQAFANPVGAFAALVLHKKLVDEVVKDALLALI